VDEQRVRARLAALDQANLALNFAGMTYGGEVSDIAPAVIALADAFENWLMRPELIDVTGVSERPDCDTETSADRLGYQRCATAWRRANGQLHRCRYAPDHSAVCVCACGDRADR
jgi:hypothetical protein